MKYWLALAAVLLWASSAVAQEEDFNTQLMRATVKISHDKSTGTGFVLLHDGRACAAKHAGRRNDG